ncbi:MAG: cobalamin-dependent protein [Gemmatimonadota bacterium]
MSEFNERLHLTTTQVAELLGVHASTVKRWCDGTELWSEKTEGGHRRIHLRHALDVARTKGIRTFLTPFTPFEGHVWSAVQDVVERQDFGKVVSLSMGWLVRGHPHRIGHLFYALGLHPQVSLPQLLDEGVRRFMEAVGESWRQGRIRVGEEHMASQVVAEALIRLSQHDRISDSSGQRAAASSRGNGRVDEGKAQSRVAVVGSMEGDQHHLGSLCIRLLLEREGWKVYYLGPDVPVEEFAAIQRAQAARLVCVSFSPPATGADMVRCFRMLTEFYRPSSPYALAFGGGVSDPVSVIPEDLPFKAFRSFPDSTSFVEWVRGSGGRMGLEVGND